MFSSSFAAAMYLKVNNFPQENKVCCLNPHYGLLNGIRPTIDSVLQNFYYFFPPKKKKVYHIYFLGANLDEPLPIRLLGDNI